MSLSIEHINGMRVNALDFDPKSKGEIYVTNKSPIHFIDELGIDYFRIPLGNGLHLLFKINHNALYHFFLKKSSFLDLVRATPNETIYYTSDSKSVISNTSNIAIPILETLNFHHIHEKTSEYGKELIRLNEVCAAFNL